MAAAAHKPRLRACGGARASPPPAAGIRPLEGVGRGQLEAKAKADAGALEAAGDARPGADDLRHHPLKGKNVVSILSGGNLDTETLREVFGSK